MVRLSDIVATLTSAYLLTGDSGYADSAIRHLGAWFVDDETWMNPELLYGQAIKGICSGRSIGLIDTLHLTEVARSARLLRKSRGVCDALEGVCAWFRCYLDWLNTHDYGITEREHPNNHGVCWSMQAAAFADLVGDADVLAFVRDRFKTVYLAEMMDETGGFPAELARTKPYGYSLFVIDAMAGIAQIASTAEDDLWAYSLPDGRGMRKGVAFIYPYIEDKSTWPLKPDVLYWDEWPVRHPSLLFAGLKFQIQENLDVWESRTADPETFEVLRSLPIRHPVLWVER